MEVRMVSQEFSFSPLLRDHLERCWQFVCGVPEDMYSAINSVVTRAAHHAIGMVIRGRTAPHHQLVHDMEDPNRG